MVLFLTSSVSITDMWECSSNCNYISLRRFFFCSFGFFLVVVVLDSLRFSS